VGGAGFRYEFNDQMGVGFGYKFLATGQPSWDVFSFTSGSSGQFQIDKARTHSFLAEFTWRF
jgi:opacity protein-like surface antigen